MKNQDQSVELTFMPIHEGQLPVVRRVSKKMLKWLANAQPVSLEDLQKIMASTPPPDSSTIGTCDK